MVFLGLGFGLSTVPATEAIMGVVSTAKAGVGSAINDATRELGGTLGVAIIGSVALSIYRTHLTGHHLTTTTVHHAEQSVVAAFHYATHLAATGHHTAAGHLAALTRTGFLNGLQAGCLLAAAVTLTGAALILRYLPSHPPDTILASDPLPSTA
jgi:hypothetical protein